MLTPVGERFRNDMTGALALIASAALQARSSEGVEVLRIHVSPSFASLWLMPRLPAFLSEHPDLRIQLSAAHTHSDFTRGEVDLDIRYGAVKWGDLHVETIFEEEMLPLVSPALLARSVVRSAEQLLAQPLIFSDVNVVQWPRWFAAHGVPLSPATYPLRFDRAYLVIDAAAQGLGYALESARLAESYLGNGTLVPAFAGPQGNPGARAPPGVSRSARALEQGRTIRRVDPAGGVAQESCVTAEDGFALTRRAPRRGTPRHSTRSGGWRQRIGAVADHLEEGLAVADHVEVVARALLDGAAPFAQAGDLGRQLRVALGEARVHGLLRRELALELRYAQPAALAQPQRPLDRQQQHGQDSGDDAHRRQRTL